MIRKFCTGERKCDLFLLCFECLGMKVLNSVFEILSDHSYSLLQTQKYCKFYDERVEENDKRVRL